MKKTTKKKSAREKRVLIGALGVAAVMVAGSTFAWFSSKDEVTNRLSASANYGVSIVEDFTPPENMTPGQEVNKDVSVVNTGNIDALVRVQLENMLKIKNYSSVDLADGDDVVSKYVMSDGTQTNTLATGETAAYQLKDFKITYPTTIPTGNTPVELSSEEYTDSNGNKHANEVSLIQAGGELVVAAGVAVDVNDQAVKSGDDSNDDYHGADQYKPTETGLYIFRRTYYETDSTESETVNKVVRYSGYWYEQKSGSTTAGDGTYTALVTDVVDGTNATVYLPAGAVTEGNAGTGKVVTALNKDYIKIKTTKEANPEDTANNFDYEFGKLTTSGTTETWTAVTADTAPDKNNATHIKLTYDPTKGATGTNPTTDDAVFYIALASDWSTNWTYINNPTAVTNGATNEANLKTYGTPIGHFYLNNDLEAGATSPKLITSVTMSNTVTQQAFVDLTYDINVVLDSVQITFDADGNEILPGGAQIGGKDSITADTGKTDVLEVKAQVTNRTNGEINAITWTAN